MAQTSSSPGPRPDRSPGDRVSAGLLTFGIAIALFFPGLALHESLHLIVLRLVGGDGLLIVRPWAFALFDLTLPSVHVQPVPALDVGRQLVVNFFGPALAAAVFAIPLFYVRDHQLRLAFGASVGVLIFYAVIEAGYVLLDAYLHVEAEVLVTPEFNYGVPLAICLAAGLAAAAVSRKRPPRPLPRAVR
jgi:hypothetical protein